MLQARDVMTSDVASIGPQSSVQEIADLLVSQRISALPVLDGDRLIGMVSEGDLIRRVEIGTAPRPRSYWLRIFTESARLAREYITSHSIHATDVMTANVVTVSESTSILEIVDILEQKRIKQVPVLRKDRIVGLVSRANLVRAIAMARHTALKLGSRDDNRIRQDVLCALRHEAWTSVGTGVSVRDGMVTFSGTVRSKEERRASHILAENIVGVRGIDDRRIFLDANYGIA